MQASKPISNTKLHQIQNYDHVEQARGSLNRYRESIPYAMQVISSSRSSFVKRVNENSCEQANLLLTLNYTTDRTMTKLKKRNQWNIW